MDDQRANAPAIRRGRLLPSGPARQLILSGVAIVVIGVLMAVASGMVLLAVIIAGCALAVFGLRVLALFLPSSRYHPMQPPASQPPSLAAVDLDEPSRALLQRAASAIDAITSSQVYRDGVVDRSAVRTVLARQQRDIDGALREQARLGVRQADLPESSLAARVDALERYAAEIRAADTAYWDWPHAGRLSEQDGQHIDMLARTAAEEYRIAEIDAMSQQARAVRLALREPPPSDPAAQRTADPALRAETPDPPPLPGG
jgi:hypothetical protein